VSASLRTPMRGRGRLAESMMPADGTLAARSRITFLAGRQRAVTIRPYKLMSNA
jgi:hypothetical protein